MVQCFYTQKTSPKRRKAIAQFLLQAIEEIGPANVLQVIADNASNCKSVGREIQKICVS
jgi:hypothetical protein